MLVPSTREDPARPAAATDLSQESAATARAADRLVYLDGWRGMAILFVLVGHFLASASGRLSDVGVECFFVLSGRLMAEILVFRRLPIPTFLARRASRILPALIVYVAAMIALVPVASAFGSPSGALYGGAAALAFVHNYLAAADVLPIFQHSWSLAVEEHAYLLLAALMVVTRRDPRAAAMAALLMAAIAVVNGIRVAAIADPADQFVYWRTDVRAGSIFLAFGLYIGVRQRMPATLPAAMALLSPLCLAAGLMVLLMTGNPEYVRLSLGTTLLAVAVGTVDLAHPLFRRLFEARPLVWFGTLSFSLYLWQQPFFVLSKVGAPLIACIAAAGVAGWCSFHWIEKPARATLNGLRIRRGIARPAPASP